MKYTRKKTDFIANKAMCVFGLAILGILGLVGISRAANTSAGYVSVLNLRWVAIAVGAVGLICAVVWLLKDKKRETEPMRYFSGIDLGVLSLLILVSGLLLCFFDVLSVTRVLYILFPACAVLYLVFILLPRSFFLQTLLCGGGLRCMWVVSRSVTRTALFAAILGLVLTALFCVFFFLLKKGDGTLKLGKSELPVLPKGEDYRPAFVSVLVCAVLFILAACLFQAAAAGSILLYILCGYLFILTVYYIVKLM